MDFEDKCVNVPSYSLPMSMIIKVATIADNEDRSQSSIIKEALEQWFKSHNPMKKK